MQIIPIKQAREVLNIEENKVALLKKYEDLETKKNVERGKD